MKNREELLKIVEESEASASSEGDDYSTKMMLYIVAAAKAAGVDLADKDTVASFVDSLKALITRDKAQLTAALRKYAKKDAKTLSKLAMKAD